MSLKWSCLLVHYGVGWSRGGHRVTKMYSLRGGRRLLVPESPRKPTAEWREACGRSPGSPWMTVILERSPPSLKSEQNTTRADPALHIKLRAASLHRTLAASFVALAKSAMRSRYGLKLLYRLSLAYLHLSALSAGARRRTGTHRCATDFAIAKPCAGGSQTKISRDTPGPPKPPRAAKRRMTPSTR